MDFSEHILKFSLQSALFSSHMVMRTLSGTFSFAFFQQRFGPKTHKLSGFESGHKPVLVFGAQLGRSQSIQQQNILDKRLKKLSNQTKFDGTKHVVDLKL